MNLQRSIGNRPVALQVINPSFQPGPLIGPRLFVLVIDVVEAVYELLQSCSFGLHTPEVGLQTGFGAL